MVHNPNAHIPHQFNSADTAWGRPVPQQQMPPAGYNYPTVSNMPPAHHYAPQPDVNQFPQPAPFRNNHQPQEKSRRGLYFTVGSVVAALAATGSLYGILASKSNGQEGVDETKRTETSQVAGDLPPLDMFYTDIRNQDYGRQLDVVMPFLEEQRAESMSALELPDPNQFTGDKKVAQEEFNAFAADIRTASVQENSILGRNLLSGVFAPTADSLKSMSAQVGNGQGAISSRRLVDNVSMSYTSGVIDLGTEQIKISDETKLVNVINLDNSTVWNAYISDFTSQDGKYTTPKIVAMVEYGHSKFISSDYVGNWSPESE